MRAQNAPETELVASVKDDPAFVIGWLDDKRQYKQSVSTENRQVQMTYDGGGEVTAVFRRIADRDLDVTIRIQASKTQKLSRWSIAVTNNAGIEIVDIQFPFVVCPYQLGGDARSETIVLPHGYGSGRLLHNPDPSNASGKTGRRSTLPSDSTSWLPDNAGALHYPGMQFAQFLAYHNDRAGVYLACEDTEGRVKHFGVFDRGHRVRLRATHIGDWPSRGTRRLEYDVVLGTFQGDWYDAAELYRAWSLQQKWATPLGRRDDVPAWLLDSPVYVAIHPECDKATTKPIVMPKEFLPYDKCLPLLDRIARHVKAPLAPILLGFERSGSWSYPESLPWAGGEESLKAFIRQARQRGWHVGTFGNGSRWVVGHKFSGYDGKEYFEQHGGLTSVCRHPNGEPVRETWDVSWRPSYRCCLGTPLTRQLAADYVGTLAGWGMESLQFFDQNLGASTFPCFARDHEHPPVPGKWMIEKMVQTMGELRQAGERAGQREVAHSSESSVNEYCLPWFQETEFRMLPPPDGIPLYHYLFHECIVIQGMWGFGDDPYHLQIQNAANAVWGSIPGGTMTGDGTLLNKNTPHIDLWEPKIGTDEDGLAMIRAVSALRRGPGKPFLVFGRMLRPAQVSGIPWVSWTYLQTPHRVPAVFHSAWQSPDGRFGVVLANWTKDARSVAVTDKRLGQAAVLHLSGRQLQTSKATRQLTGFPITLPPLSCAVLVDRDSRSQGQIRTGE